jgi:hypothetical protein
MKTKNSLAVVLIAITCLLSLSCEPMVERAREEFEGRNLSGTWYVNGDPNQRAEIVSTRGGLEARNEKGDTSRLIVERGGDIRAEDWEGGLRGDVSRDRITWANRSTWTREPSRR